MKERQLLLTMNGVIERIHVKGQSRRRLIV